MRCVLNVKKYKYRGACCRNFKFKRRVWPLQNSSGIPPDLGRKFLILFVFCQFTKVIKPTPTKLPALSDDYIKASPELIGR